MPEKRTASCGMIVIRLRRSSSPIVEISMPSMTIFPLEHRSEEVSSKAKRVCDDGRADAPSGLGKPEEAHAERALSRSSAANLVTDANAKAIRVSCQATEKSQRNGRKRTSPECGGERGNDRGTSAAKHEEVAEDRGAHQSFRAA